MSNNIINCNYDFNSINKAFLKSKKKMAKPLNPFFKKKNTNQNSKKNFGL